MSPDSFPVFPGLYNLLFLYFEPITTLMTSVTVTFAPGPLSFYHHCIPSDLPIPTTQLDPRTLIVIWQLANCFLLIGLMLILGLRAVRDALPDNPVAQERIIGAIFLPMGIADLIHITIAFTSLPPDWQYAPSKWNVTVHGNITIPIVIVLFRMAWFAGMGRIPYYYGKPAPKARKAL